MSDCRFGVSPVNYPDPGDMDAYCVCTHGLLVGTRVIISLMRTVYTLKFSGTHPLFNLMCTRIKHLGKVFIKTPK